MSRGAKALSAARPMRASGLECGDASHRFGNAAPAAANGDILVAPNPKRRLRVAALQDLSEHAGFLSLLLSLWVAGSLYCSHAAEWSNSDGYRWKPLQVPLADPAGFTSLPGSQTGITFTNTLSPESAANNRILENGSGVALGDIDGDGLPDIYLCRMEGGNALYRNLGNWKFEEITIQAGVACSNNFSTGAVFADLDGDGDLDLLVNGIGHGTRYFQNDGKGRFTERRDSGLSSQFGATSMALADVDGDGDLDLYVTNYRTTTFRDPTDPIKPTYQVNGNKVQVQPADRFTGVMRGKGFNLIEKGEADFLYLNDGKGKFKAVAWDDGTFLEADGSPLKAIPQSWGLSAAFHDVNGDGWPDLYICNDFLFFPDTFWFNDGKGHFRAAPMLAQRHMSMSSMAVDFADFNRDGFVDFFVADMLASDHMHRQTQRGSVHPEYLEHAPGLGEDRPEIMHNTLFLNRGDHTFAEVAQLAGVHSSDWSWCAAFLDVDLDGYEDLLITTGNAHDVSDMDTGARVAALNAKREGADQIKPLPLYPPLFTSLNAFRNQRDFTFRPASEEWHFNHVGVAQGMAMADLDGDGDLDVVINNLNGEASILRNDSPAPRVHVRLAGNPPNTRGIGARITLLGAVRPQTQEIIAGGRYLSGDEAARVFAAPPGANMELKVVWRSGKQSVVTNIQSNRLYEIQESIAQSPPATTNSPIAPWFKEETSFKYVHQEEAFDDFSRQPLLPNKLSQSGPGAAWFDLDGDGRDDLLVGGGRGGALSVFLNRPPAGLRLFGTQKANRDQTSLIGYVQPGGARAFLLGSSNYEDGQQTGSPVRQFNFMTRKVDELLPGQDSATGPLCLADLKGDGKLSMFAGGRSVPGKYPISPASAVYQFDGGSWKIDEENSRAVANAGMVSAAVFADLTGDGLPELILACDWGPVRVFENHGGKLREATERLQLGQSLGWWAGVTVGDFDSDGRLDIAASNLGRNSKYNEVSAKPVRLYWGDLDGDGSADLVEAVYDRQLGGYVPIAALDVLSKSIPSLNERFPNFGAFAKLKVEEIFPAARLAKVLEVNTHDSMVFLNRGDHFERRSLPMEAQFAPAFGISAADFDGDGRTDLFLSQNLFATQPETSRYDAGTGLLLQGLGDGSFRALSHSESGVFLPGEQRASATSDYDGDGRLDLLVTQNAAPAKLYHNERASPGRRARLLKGGAPAIGAILRPIAKDGKAGAAQVITAGSGFYSQDSAVLVLPSQSEAVRVEWAGGKLTTNQIPPGIKAFRLEAEGMLTPE